MNFSVYSADRATHLRVVVVALVASIAIVGFSIVARDNLMEPIQAMNIGRYEQVKIPAKESFGIRPRDGMRQTLSACGRNCDIRSGS
jgi:hypothetical protein